LAGPCPRGLCDRCRGETDRVGAAYLGLGVAARGRADVRPNGRACDTKPDRVGAADNTDRVGAAAEPDRVGAAEPV